MNFFDRLILNYYQLQNNTQRTVGRYWATDLYNIIEKKISPRDFLTGEEKKDLTTYKYFFRGEMVEFAVKFLLEKTEKNIIYQDKKEMKINDWYLVCKPDFIVENNVLEIKGSHSLNNNIKSYHLYQLEAYSRCYPTQKIYIAYLNPNLMHLKIFEYQPKDELWQKIINQLNNFHCRLKKYEQLSKGGKGGKGNSQTA